MRALRLALALFPALAGPAAAQMDPRPATSRAERQIIENNRALEFQQQQRALTQQNQFEINALRNQLQQQQMFPPPGRAGSSQSARTPTTSNWRAAEPSRSCMIQGTKSTHW